MTRQIPFSTAWPVDVTRNRDRSLPSQHDRKEGLPRQSAGPRQIRTALAIEVPHARASDAILPSSALRSAPPPPAPGRKGGAPLTILNRGGYRGLPPCDRCWESTPAITTSTARTSLA